MRGQGEDVRIELPRFDDPVLEEARQRALHERTYAIARARRKQDRRRARGYVQRAQRYNSRARIAELAAGELPGSRGRVTPAELKELVAEYDSRCLHCKCELDFLRRTGEPTKQNIATFDHLISLSAGGRGDKDNLAPACAPCNQGRERLRLKRERLKAERERERSRIYRLKRGLRRLARAVLRR